MTLGLRQGGVARGAHPPQPPGAAVEPERARRLASRPLGARRLGRWGWAAARSPYWCSPCSDGGRGSKFCAGRLQAVQRRQFSVAKVAAIVGLGRAASGLGIFFGTFGGS